MARTRRLKHIGPDVYYHLISRTVGQEFYLGDVEKEYLMNLIAQYSALYFVKLVGFCIMDNHFHILVKSESYKEFTHSTISDRLSILCPGKKLSHPETRKALDKLGNISEYMKSIKETFSRWYNKTHNRTGYFWGDRFKSVIVEQKAALAHCLAYIDLNPIRAKIVERPEKYRWSSIYARMNNTPLSKQMSFVGIFDDPSLTKKRALLLYRKFMYACGAVDKGATKGVISQKVALQEKELGFTVPAHAALCGRVRYFTDGCVIGSKTFVSKMYGLFRGRGLYKKNEDMYDAGFSPGILSIQRLKSCSAM